MICGNERARKWRDALEREAHVRTANVRVVVVHPRFVNAEPEYRNGTVRLPAWIFSESRGFWARTWRHELQHAADDRSGLLAYITRDEAEERARRAEHAEPRASRHP